MAGQTFVKEHTVPEGAPQAGRTRNAIEVREVSKKFRGKDGNLITALEGVSLSVGKGEFITVVGPSGCGKTTLLRMIADLSEPTTGTIVLHGKAEGVAPSQPGIVFQRSVLLPWRNVLDNILVPGEVKHMRRKSMVARGNELLELVGLEGSGTKYPSELSGGMQQRVSIARALLLDPDVLLMDEPFGALDAMTRDTMCEELLRIVDGQGKTVVFITHSISEAVLLADRVVVMSSSPGRISSEIHNDLPAPRNLTSMGLPRFGELTAQVRDDLGLTR